MVLPDPWNNATFCLDQVRPVNYLVGPNGSGKSRFAAALGAKLPKSRLLPTDRLTGMEQHWSFPQFSSQQFEQGLARSRFSGLTAPVSAGSGIAALAMLEERLDVRIQVEATLRHLFNREIYFDWDEGNLVPKARRRGTGNSLYRLDRDECHGIKELCVLLANLYDETVDYLLVDEPELNLHPQLQAFLVQEIHKVAGDPSITTTHLGCDACRWPISFVNVRRATVLSVRALRSFPEAVRQTVVAILGTT